MRENTAGYADHGGCAALDIVVGGAPVGNADTHGCFPLPFGAAAPASALCLNCRDDLPRLVRRSEGDEDLVQDHFVEDCKTGAFEACCKETGLPAVTFYEFAKAGSAKGTHGSP